MNQPQDKAARRLLLLWAIIATLVGIVSTIALVVLMLQFRSSAVHPVATQMTPFLELGEDTVPGRYRRIEGGKNRGVITLLPDHSFLDAKGDLARVHQWAVGRDALFLTWMTGMERFTNVESPGVYTTTTPDGQYVRMEKEQ